MFEERVREGFDVFIHDGEKSCGAVREVRREGLVIYVENGGDFLVPLSAIKDVHSEKVILDGAKLDMKLKEAIRRARSGEDPRI